MEPDGMLNGSKINERIKIAINIAKKIDFKLLNKESKNFMIFKNKRALVSFEPSRAFFFSEFFFNTELPKITNRTRITK